MQDNKTNSRWPITVEQAIAAPADDVWIAISTAGNLETCHPFCKRNPVHAWGGAQSCDEIHYLSGRVYERRFREWHDGVGYDLDIYDGDRHLAAVSWRINEVDQESSTLQITVLPLLPPNWPVVLRWFAHWLRLKPYLRSYLRSVVMGVDWYVTKGEAVPRNHWGKHPWYSAE